MASEGLSSFVTTTVEAATSETLASPTSAAFTDSATSTLASAVTSAISSATDLILETATATMASSSTFRAFPTPTPEVDSCHFTINPAAFDPSSPEYAIHITLWSITIVFAAVATAMSLYLIWKHFEYYYRPEFQRYIVRILLMVPIYSIISCVSFRYVWYSVYFDVIRDAYEGFVLYSFYTLLLHFLGLDPDAQSARLKHISKRRLPMPLCCCIFTPGSRAFLVNCKVGVLQYAVIRPAMAVVAVVLEALGLLCPDDWGTGTGQFWVTLINFTSCTIALYALVLFYLVTSEELAEYKPLYKFVAIKFVIFFSYWQSLFLSLIAYFNLYPSSEYFSSSNVQAAVQSFLICIEMVIAARLHIIAFPYHDYVPPGPGGASKKTDVSIGIRDSLNMRDFVRDVGEGPELVEEGLRSAVGRTGKAVALTSLSSNGGAVRTEDDDDDFGYDASRDPSRIQVGGYANLNQYGMTVAERDATEEVSRPQRAATSSAAPPASAPVRKPPKRDPFSLSDSEDEEEPQFWAGDDVPLRSNAGSSSGGGRQPPPSIL